MPPTVYFSYALDDVSAILNLKAALVDRGVVIVDRTSLPDGASWESAMDSAEMVLVCYGATCDQEAVLKAVQRERVAAVQLAAGEIPALLLGFPVIATYGNRDRAIAQIISLIGVAHAETSLEMKAERISADSAELHPTPNAATLIEAKRDITIDHTLRMGSPRGWRSGQ